MYPDFASVNKVVSANEKWQDTVEALGRFEKFIQENPSSFSKSQEAVVQYAMLFSKDFKAANMNILKAAFSIAKIVISSCGAGPRACQPVILAALAKIHDKKLGSELFALLSVIAEKIGPDAVIAQVLLLAPSHVVQRGNGEESRSRPAEGRSAVPATAGGGVRRDLAQSEAPSRVRDESSRIHSSAMSSRASRTRTST